MGLPADLLPPVCETGVLAGPLAPDVARAVGLPQGTPVTVAMGDNQASFLGAVAEPTTSLLLNMGTGAQFSALAGGYTRLPGLDTRYFPGGRYLLVGAGLFGGRTYGYLQAFFRRVGEAFYGAHGDENLLAAMDRLAAGAPPGCDGLRCTPWFTGTRTDPAARARFDGVTPDNLTPGHLARAVLEGMAEAFHGFYEEMAHYAGARGTLVGSGNGVRRNRLMAEILAARFGMPLRVPELDEEAAVGAALAAAVGLGDAATWDDASAGLRYRA